eukprot:tig00000984_g5993.t1
MPGARRSAPSAADDVDTANFMPGSLVRIHLRNFVTYTDAQFAPGKRLNLILGPNGSGKSSIVAGIIIGLNGDIAHIGRARELKAYIKHGCKDAFVEIELKGRPGEQNTVVRRTFTAGASNKDATSTWTINEQKSSGNDVKKLTKSFNIQVSNLCQCLPQDRVAAFSRMGERELLRETQSAVDATLIDAHQKLIDFNKRHADDERSFKKDEERLAALKVEQERSQREVDKIEQHRQIQDEIEACRKMLPWAVFEVHRQEAKAANDRKKEAERAMEEAEALYDAADRPYQEAKQQLEAKRGQIADRQKRIQKAAGDVEGAGRAFRDRETALVQADKARKEEEKGREERRKKADRERGEIARIESELATMKSPQAMTEEQNQLNATDTDLKKKMRGKQEKERELLERLRPLKDEEREAKRELGEMNQARNARLKRLYEIFRHCRLDAQTQWIEENRASFKGRVYGPLGAELEVTDEYHARVLETQLSKDAMQGFVFEDREDRQRAADAFKKNNVKGVTFRSQGMTEAHLLPVGDFAQYGVVGYLEDLFDAPPLVKAILRDVSSTHKVLVCDERVEQGGTVNQLVDALARASQGRLPVTGIYSPTSRYGIVASRYTSDLQRETRLLQRGPLKFLGGAADPARKEELERQLAGLAEQIQAVERDLQDVRGALRELELETNSIASKRDTLREARLARSSKEQRFRLHQRTLQELTRERDDEAERERCEAAYAAGAGARGAAVAALARALEAAKREAAPLPGLQLRERQLDELAGRLQNERRRVEEVRKHAANDLKHATTEADNTKKKAKELRKQAEQVIPVADLQELQDRFPDLPSDARALEELMESKEREARALLPNERVLQEHADRGEQITELEQRLASERARLADRLGEFERLKKDWLPRVRQLVKAIHSRFERRFRMLKCVGEVQLHEEGEEFDKFGIRILTKFRDDEALSRLDAMRQSGGERSVSTMLYLMSLQALTKCPFRVVDEINQGMDATNERRVFGMLVETAKQPGPQYFLVTPKLLSDLPYGPDVTALFVFHGPGLNVDWKKWDFAGFMGQAQRLSEGTAVGGDPEEEAARAAAQASDRKGKKARHS